MEQWQKTAAEQLFLMGLHNSSCSLLREKDGVSVCRVLDGDRHLILKYFAHEADRREIRNYQILNSLDIQTIPLIAQTDCAILMEDIEYSDGYRLGIREDLNDPLVTTALAAWYRKLHDAGRAYVRDHGSLLYDETELITEERLARAATQTGTENAPVWSVLRRRFDDVMGIIRGVERTLTYNDFYYTNLIVAKDRSAAFMFDYNLLGKGYVYADLRNVTCHMNEAAAEAFLSAYGPYDENQVPIDRAASALTTLILACRREEFPPWGEESLRRVRSGELLRDLEQLIC